MKAGAFVCCFGAWALSSEEKSRHIENRLQRFIFSSLFADQHEFIQPESAGPTAETIGNVSRAIRKQSCGSRILSVSPTNWTRFVNATPFERSRSHGRRYACPLVEAVSSTAFSWDR